MDQRMMRVLKPGMLTTVQDLGRWGYQTFGVPVAGAMDPLSHRLANALVLNEHNAATLEITLLGPDVEFGEATAFAVTGARFDLRLDDVAVPPNTVCTARAGSRLRFGARAHGTRSYLAVAGGFDVPRVFGSRATHLVSRMGGVEGRALIVGDCLPIGEVSREPNEGRSITVDEVPAGGSRVRIMLGPHEDRFSSAVVETLLRHRYVVTPHSNRMGYRLDGPALAWSGDDIISDAAPIGSLQVPAAGAPILLMADRGTTGGYPKIATVITADLPLAGQLGPGDWIEFVVCDRAAADDALRRQVALLGEADGVR
jgi:antagonist of KipI